VLVRVLPGVGGCDGGGATDCVFADLAEGGEVGHFCVWGVVEFGNLVEGEGELEQGVEYLGGRQGSSLEDT